MPEVDLSSIHGVSDIVSLFALGSIPKVGRGATVVALAEVMEGKKEEEMTFPSALHSMENHVITGGYPLPDEEDEEENLQEDVSVLENRFQEFPAIKERNKKIYDARETMENFQKLFYFIRELEDPFYDYNFVFEETKEGGKKKVAIKPFSARDGYITIGYGHSIQSEEEAEKYGLKIKKDDKEKETETSNEEETKTSNEEETETSNEEETINYDDYKEMEIEGESGILKYDDYKDIEIWEKHNNEKGYEMIKNYIKVQMSLYEKSGLKNPAILSMEEADELLKNDILARWEQAINKAAEIGKDFTPNQIAALTSVIYNGTDVDDEDTISYQFLKGNQKDAINKLKEAIEKDWYAGREGTLWRRLRECNIFYFNDYTDKDYENTPEGIENLKRKLGWYE